MKQEQIKTLIDALAGSDLSELEFSENGSTLRLVKRSAGAAAARRPAQPAKRDAIQPSGDDAGVVESAVIVAAPIECFAPLYGVVHLQSSPGDPPFVQPGGRAVTDLTPKSRGALGQPSAADPIRGHFPVPRRLADRQAGRTLQVPKDLHEFCDVWIEHPGRWRRELRRDV